MANYPLVTWNITAPAFEIRRVGGSGGTYPVIEKLYSAASPYYGFELVSAGTKVPNLNSLLGRVVSALGSSTYTTGAAGLYVIQNNTNPSTSALTGTASIATITGGGTSIVVDFYTPEAAAVYGFATTTLTFSAFTGLTKTAIYSPDGVWVPCGVTGDVRRTTMQRAAASSSEMSGLVTDVVNWGEVADIEVMSSIFPAGNLTKWFASTQIYASAAGRNVDDPNNTLESLLAAAARGATFRLYREPSASTGAYIPGDYQVARMPLIANRSSAADYSTADDTPRLWSTNGLIFRGE